MRRALFLVAAAIGLITLDACGGGNGGGLIGGPVPETTVTSAPNPTPTPAPTPTPYLAALGDSITWGGGASGASNDYVSLLGRGLGAAQVTNLGIIGETDIPEPNSVLTGTAANGVPYAPMGGVLADEVPNIPITANVVTLYIGTNDTWVAQAMVKPDFSNEAVLQQVGAMFAKDIVETISGIRARVPMARIVVATNVNVADKSAPGLGPLNFEPYLTYRSDITAMVNTMNAAIASTGVVIADLHCDPALYDPAYYTPDFIHPNDAGHARIAADFLSAIQHGGTADSCIFSGVE